MGAAQAQSGSLLPGVLSVGWTPFPHSYIEVLPGKVSGLTQFVAIGYIIRRTFGLERERKTAPPEWTEPITAKTFARIAKGANERTIELVLEDAVERGLIARKRAADKRGYVYKALVECWVKAPGYAPRAAPKKPVASTEEAHNAAAEASGPEEKAALKPRLVKPQEALVILPGQTSRPIPLEDAVRSVVIRNDSAGELRIPVPLVSDERLFLAVRAKYPNYDSGIPPSPEETNTRTPARVSSETSTRTPVRVSSALLEHFQEDPRYEPIERRLDPWFEQAYGKSLETSLLCQILERLGNAPADKYLQLCESEWRRWQKRREQPSSGMFLNWADDAKVADDKRFKRTDRERRENEASEQKARIRSLAMCLREQVQPMVSEIDAGWKSYIERTLREAANDELLDAKLLLESGELL